MKKANKKLIRLNKIKLLLSKFEFALPGTIRTLYMKCGKAGCPCQKDDNARHGPYNLWDRKVDKKLSSKMIPSTDLKKMRIWIEERRKLEKLVEEALSLSQEIVNDMIEKSKGDLS